MSGRGGLAGRRDERTPFVREALLALDGQLDPEGERSLRAELAADVEKRRLFVGLCLQAQALFELLGPQQAAEIPGLAGPEAPEGGSAGRWTGVVSARREGWRHARLPWSVAAAACLLAALVIGLSTLRRPGRPAPTGLPAVAGEPREGVAADGGGGRVGPGFDRVAVVLQLDGARWRPSGGPPPAAREIVPARRLLLDAGRATLALLSGVTLTLEGPADVDLVSVDRVFCRRGRLRASVPRGAEGFVIASPSSAIVDRGTEFAVNVDSDGRSRVFVFEGVAEAALLDAEGSPKVTQIMERSQSFELDPTTGRIDESDATPDGFVRAPDLAAPALGLGASYADAVLASRPVGFWRFESAGGGTMANEVPGGPPLRSHGAVATSAGAGGNGCAVFRAGEPDQFLFTDGLWELARSPGHAVELWFMPEVIGDATLVGLFPPKDHLARWKRGRFVHTLLLELTAYERGSLFKPASIRFLHRWPLDTRIGNNLVSERLYIPGRWHHVVAQKNGDRLELFLDGELERVMPLKPDHPTLSCRLVVGRRNPDPLEPEDARPFVGRIDELAIYDRPLGIEEIRNHHRLAATEESPLAIRTGR